VAGWVALACCNRMLLAGQRSKCAASWPPQHVLHNLLMSHQTTLHAMHGTRMQTLGCHQHIQS
jgi:hypothetical protein